MTNCRNNIVKMLAGGVEQCRKEFDRKTGKFLCQNGGWAVTNQDVIWPLAWLYANPDADNPFYQDASVLELALAGGDALQNTQDQDGRWEFVKTDGSRWGKTFMCWSALHWLEAFSTLREGLDADRLKKWEHGLKLCYEGIFAERPQLETANFIHNINAWNAAALYKAGQVFSRPEWMQYARDFFSELVKAMNPDGYWPEGAGPTTLYNLVYAHALGLYFAMARDAAVIPALNAVTEFHRHFTYPDGTCVETVDGRVKHEKKPSVLGIPCFLVSENGRSFAAFLAECLPAAYPDGLCSPQLASALTVRPDNLKPEAPLIQRAVTYRAIFNDHATIRKQNGFYACLSGYVVQADDQPKYGTNRWYMDRSAFISLWHEKYGLIIGGGNSKDQPLWSNFSFWHGNRKVWCPVDAKLSSSNDEDILTLNYAGPVASIRLNPIGRDSMRIVLKVEEFGLAEDVTASLPLRLCKGMELRAGDKKYTFDPMAESGFALGQGMEMKTDTWTMRSSRAAYIRWPVYPFNPYAIDGAVPLDQACAMIAFNPDRECPAGEFVVRIVK